MCSDLEFYATPAGRRRVLRLRGGAGRLRLPGAGRPSPTTRPRCSSRSRSGCGRARRRRSVRGRGCSSPGPVRSARSRRSRPGRGGRRRWSSPTSSRRAGSGSCRSAPRPRSTRPTRRVDLSALGVDAFIECSGATPALISGLHALRESGTAVLVGLGAEEITMPGAADRVPRARAHRGVPVRRHLAGGDRRGAAARHRPRRPGDRGVRPGGHRGRPHQRRRPGQHEVRRGGVAADDRPRDVLAARDAVRSSPAATRASGSRSPAGSPRPAPTS